MNLSNLSTSIFSKSWGFCGYQYKKIWKFTHFLLVTS
jgi:hypothetical protein